mgnify:CR=1 FL=1
MQKKGLTIKYYKCNIKRKESGALSYLFTAKYYKCKNNNRIGSKELVAVVCSEKTEAKERGDRNGDRTRKREKEAVCVQVCFTVFDNTSSVCLRAGDVIAQMRRQK